MNTSTTLKPSTSLPSEKIKAIDNPAMKRLAAELERQSQTSTQAYTRQHHRHNRS